MTSPTLIASALLVAPLLAPSEASPIPPAQASKTRTVVVRACVMQGTHGSPGNLTQIEADPGTDVLRPGRLIYWFYTNPDGFKEHVGQQTEISGTVVEVHDESLELKASDGVFAEIMVPAAGARSTATETAGVAPGKVAAPVSASREDAGPDNGATTVWKIKVEKLRMLGSCSPNR